MKLLRQLGIISIALVIVVSMAGLSIIGCDNSGGSGSSEQTPVAADYTVSQNLVQSAGSVTAVTVTGGRSPGLVTVYYEGTSGTVYPRSTSVPQEVGIYAVTFDVASASGWKAASKLPAGTLEVNSNRTPVYADYIIGGGGLTQTAGSVAAITVTKDPSKNTSPSDPVVYYAGNTTVPQAAGTYAVTAEVAAAEGWNKATISIGNLIVNAAGNNKLTPELNDYNVTNLDQVAGDVTQVIITPKREGRNPPAATNIKYNGAAVIPQAVGTYTVTFEVVANDTWNAATLTVGRTLNVTAANLKTPVASDYEFDKLFQTAGSVVNVVITPKAGKSTGAILVILYGDNSVEIPQTDGTYPVHFNVGAAAGWNAVNGLSAGNLRVSSDLTPAASEYNVGGTLAQKAGNVTNDITVTQAGSGSTGAVTIYFKGINNTDYAKSTTIPQDVGEYVIIFDVAAVAGFNPVTGLYHTGSYLESSGGAGDGYDSAKILVVKQVISNAENFATISWDDDNNATINGSTSITTTGSCTLSVGGGFTVVGWYVNGVSVNTTTPTYTFSSGQAGSFKVSVLALKDGKVYDASTVIAVQ